MIPSSHLRVYQPLDSFPKAERARWEAYVAGPGPRSPASIEYRNVAFEGSANSGVIYPIVAEHAFVRKINGRWLICPWRMRLRMLVGLLNFRNALPQDVADAFVPDQEAEKAIDELDKLRSHVPGMRANIATASFHVPIRWFVPFDDSERILTDEDGRARVRYETDLAAAKGRVERALAILKSASLPEGVVSAVSDLSDWLNEFPSDSLVELDYGSVADLFEAPELISDRSAGEIWACLEALESGDFDESSQRYARLAGWWGRVQALENSN